jgi:putative ABC transport system permease protein
MVISIGFCLAGALTAARRAARIHPADAMRPEPPHFGQRVLLERIPILWRNLSFTWKMILRNIGRNRYRAALNVCGVAVSTAFLLMGFFSIDSMHFALRFQYREVQREDVKLTFQMEHGKNMLHEVSRLEHVRRAEPLLQYPFEIRSGWHKKDIAVIGLSQESELQKIMTFSGEQVSLPDEGLVLSDKLARILDVGPGSKVVLKPLMGRITREKEVTVKKVSQQFLGTNAYMELGALSRVLDEPFVMNAALLRIEEGTKDALNRRLKDIAGIASVGFNEDAYQAMLDTIAASMWIMNVILLFFAGVIAFSIIYNITSVALAERQRELASLRVLGFTLAEVGRILYHENFLLGILGVICGIPLGIGICQILVMAYDTELYRLPFHIDRESYVTAVLMTLFFVFLANLAVWRRIRRLDMIEVLKERE